ncbi:hypothetical protein SEEH3711_15020 [Salmonella enterica subsp. enterica serovar Heidelberg str. 622737-11]|nr:hypothetical protein SEETMRM10607_15815 [Salmonella enterica subsp. enterica serovar Typhimurium]KJT31086.1 hypothetical protein SEEH3711_15020 [Salmonella enterica subsp. enterica serovar Heidelberg str. 622737-11]KJT89791.1 hypothetical protein SEEH2823_21848 [Salmonella enterica subsp. enterica serovar Heidelberg str. 77-2823]
MNGSALMPAVYPRWRGEHGKATPFLLTSPVYPRWRGEHLGGVMNTTYQNGLSPLARGTRGGLK